MMQAFRKKLSQAIFKETNKEVKLPLGDTAWSEYSNIYSGSDFEKYNPDSLIGAKGFGIYKKMMLDEQVKAVVKFKRDAITSRDFTFELNFEEEGISEDEAKKRIDIFNQVVKNVRGSWMDFLNGVMSGMYNGFSMTEKIFMQMTYQGLTYWGIEQLKLKPFDTFSFDTDEYGNITKLTQSYGSDKQEIDIEKFIHFVINPDVDEHYGQSELRECYRAWFSKDNIIKFRNIWLERHAGGFHTAKVTGGNLQPNSPEYNALQDVLTNINTSTGIIVPNNIDLEGHYPSNNVAFKEAISDQDTAIARALLVPNLLGVSPQGDTGSYSQSNSQLEAFFWTLEADTARLEDTLNEQLWRQLGDANFGDGIYPRYKFKPVSKSKILELVNTWKDLVQSGAVTHNKADEDYIREILEMPDAVEDVDNDGATATRPDTALNGAQVSSMVEVISKIAEGILTKSAAVSILTAAFPLSKDEATEMVKDVEVQEPKNEAPSNDGNAPTKIDGGDNNDDGSGNGNTAPDDNKLVDESGNEIIEETVMGNGTVSVSAFKKATARVDFKVIEETTEVLVDKHTLATASVMDDMIADLIKKGKSGGDVKTEVTKNIGAVKADPKIKSKLKKAITEMLKDGYGVGTRHAKNEIDRAKGTAFSTKFDATRMDLIAADYFSASSFKMTGNLTDDAVKVINDIILNGAKFDWTWDKIETEIYSTFASNGMITPETAIDKLGAATTLSPDARMRTLVRTNTFDTINNARYEYFNDPELGNFVVGFEYSAIMDSRTTEICKHLEGEGNKRGAGDHTKEWYRDNKQFMPPNHYNCRSLLIPVTQADDVEFKSGRQPKVQPQVGFGGSE